MEIQGSTPPEMFKEWLRWMLPAMTPDELRSTLVQARDHAPAATYQLMLDIGQRVVEPAKWAKTIA